MDAMTPEYRARMERLGIRPAIQDAVDRLIRAGRLHWNPIIGDYELSDEPKPEKNPAGGLRE